MKHIIRSLIAIGVAGAMIQPFTATVYAHGGHCGGGGGHHGYSYGNPGNCNMGGSGVCYYYCDGYDAHLHTNGVCPYAGSAPAQSDPVQPSSVQQEVSESTIIKVQNRLNELGYSCGEADGIIGPKTESAVKKFKIDNGLRANSTIKKPVLKALGLY